MFALAAVAGFIILKDWLTSAETSRKTVYMHGIFAALVNINCSINKTGYSNFYFRGNYFGGRLIFKHHIAIEP